MLSRRLVHSGNTQRSPEQTERRDALCKAVRARVHVLQTSSCLQMTVLLAVSSIAQNKGQLEAFPQSSQGRETVPAARERREDGEPSIPMALAASLGRAEGMQCNPRHFILLCLAQHWHCPAEACHPCIAPSRSPTLLTGQAGQPTAAEAASSEYFRHKQPDLNQVLIINKQFVSAFSASCTKPTALLPRKSQGYAAQTLISSTKQHCP